MRLTVACTFDPDGLEAFADATHDSPVDLLILPELFDGGYARLQNGGNPNSTAVLAERFSEISRQHDLHLVGGSLALTDSDGTVRNRSLVFSHGVECARFDKVHLFRPLDDDRYFAPGTPGAPVVLKCREGLIRLGVIICYDLRFPEIVRPWFKSGLDLLVVPARWPRERDEIWRVLLRARAIENQCFVIGVDSRDAEGGGSYAFGPAGECLFELGPVPSATEPPWFTFELDTDLIAHVKDRLDTRADAILL